MPTFICVHVLVEVVDQIMTFLCVSASCSGLMFRRFG